MDMHPNSISSVFTEIVQENADASLHDVMARLGAEFGFGFFTYMFNPRSNINYDENIILTSYPGAWQGRYREREYHMIDPVVSHGLRSMLPLDWSIVPRNSQLIRHFFGEAGDLGVHGNGLAIPIRDHKNGRGLLTVNVDLTGGEWLDYKRDYVADLTYLGFLFHDHVQRKLQPADPRNEPHLAPREIEVLQWAANGKTREDISAILGISQSAVKLYTANACAKLKVANITHAVARCISMGLFSVA